MRGLCRIGLCIGQQFIYLSLSTALQDSSLAVSISFNIAGSFPLSGAPAPSIRVKYSEIPEMTPTARLGTITLADDSIGDGY